MAPARLAWRVAQRRAAGLELGSMEWAAAVRAADEAWRRLQAAVRRSDARTASLGTATGRSIELHGISAAPAP